MPVPTAFTLFEASSVLHAIADGKMSFDALLAADSEKLSAVMVWLDETWGNVQVLEDCSLADAFEIMGIGQEAVIQSTARLVNVLELSSVAPVKYNDLAFAHRALDGWMQILATAC